MKVVWSDDAAWALVALETRLGDAAGSDHSSTSTMTSRLTHDVEMDGDGDVDQLVDLDP
ncbi:MAG TPA: hypothetical protein VFK02_19750 [Kofleriaceae bacterium]|nr:hypothetical protein [Kofleriaceae bacterium]